MMALKSLHAGHVLGFIAALIVPVSIFAPKAIAPLFVIALVFGLALNAYHYRTFLLPPKSFVLGFSALIVWAGLSLIWADHPLVGLRLLPVLAIIFSGGLLLTSVTRGLNSNQRHLLDRGIVFGILLGLSLITIEIYSPLFFSKIYYLHIKDIEIEVTHMYANFFKAGTTVTAVMVWPALAASARLKRPFLTVGISLFGGFILLTSGGGSAVLATIGGAATFLVVWLFRRKGAILVAASLVLTVIAIPYGPPLLPDAGTFEQKNPNLPTSIFPRIYIWQSAVGFIDQAPILGLGLNSSRTLSSSKDSTIYTRPEVTGVTRVSEPIPLHPHNFALQLRLELGAVGVLIVAGLFVTIILYIMTRLSRFNAAVACATLISAAVINFVTYSAWSSWWQATIWLAAAFLTTKNEDVQT